MTGISILSDEHLMKAYHQALEIQLENEFIEILLHEIRKRGLFH